jgi:hypothetical protein
MPMGPWPVRIQDNPAVLGRNPLWSTDFVEPGLNLFIHFKFWYSTPNLFFTYYSNYEGNS